MKIYTEELYKLYMDWVDNVPDEKSIFTPKEIVNAISNIIVSNPSLIELPSDEEIKQAFESEHYNHDKGHYRKVKLDRIYGAKWLKEQILNQNK